MFSNLALKKNDFISFEDFKESFSIGKNTPYLKIRSAFDKGRISNLRRDLETSLKYPYIQPNSDYNISWLVFDIDRDFNYLEIEESNLKQPNFIIYNKENNHVQIWYRLKNPIWIQNNFSKNTVYKYYKTVYKRMRDILKADRNFSHKLCKNPFYEMYNKNCTWFKFDIHSYSYTLGELAEHLDLNFFDETIKNEKKEISINYENEYSGVSIGCRNTSLFDYVRKLAYKYYSKTSCKENDLYNFCLNVLKDSDLKNNPPVKEKELETIARSISSWTVENIQIQAHKTKKYTDKQREKSLYTRRKNKISKISKVKKLLKDSKSLSNREISKILSKEYGCGFSIDSVNRYVKEIQEEKLRKSKSKIISERFVNQFVSSELNFETLVSSDGVNLFKSVKNFLNL